MDAKCRALTLLEFGLPRNWIAQVIEKLSTTGARSLTSNEVYMILKRVGNLFKAEASVLHVHGDCRVVGNLYGRVDSLQAVFRRFGWPGDVCYVFLGDYISKDEGQVKLDVFLFLLIFKIVYPKRVLLLRGSSECEHCAAEMGLLDLLGSTFTISLYNVMKDVFKYLPLVAQVNSVYLLSNTSLSLEKGALVDLELVVRPCTTCLRGRSLRTLAMRTSSFNESCPLPLPKDEDICKFPVLMFLRKSDLQISIKDAGSEIPSRFGCTVEGSRSNVISLVTATSLLGNPFNGSLIAIHANSACTFHSVDPRLAKPPIRLIMPPQH